MCRPTAVDEQWTEVVELTAGVLSGLAGTRARRRVGRALGVITIAALLAACRLIGTDQFGQTDSSDSDVASAAGWTRIATTSRYVVVANVLPGEEMFAAAEIEARHPTEGECIIRGTGRAVGPDVRHVEAHVYDRTTGLPLDDVTLTITLLNRSTGERMVVEPTLMQDINIGGADIHYGNNVVVRGDSDLSLQVTISGEEVTLDGHLD
jgi:hypothetical protein